MAKKTDPPAGLADAAEALRRAARKRRDDDRTTLEVNDPEKRVGSGTPPRRDRRGAGPEGADHPPPALQRAERGLPQRVHARGGARRARHDQLRGAREVPAIV